MTLLILLYVIPAFLGLSTAVKCLNHTEYRDAYKNNFTSFDLGLLIFCSIVPILNILWGIWRLCQTKEL